MKLSMVRSARQMTVEGKKDKAIAMADKFFEVFPAFNFPHDQFSAYMADVYARSGAKDKAKQRILEIATQAEQQLRFIKSQNPADQASYRQDMQFSLGTVQTLMGSAAQMKDEELSAELDKMFDPYIPKGMNPSLPGVRQ